MKKFVAILLVLLMSVSSVFASTPDFLTQVMTNYTADYNVKISFDNSEELAQLLRETDFYEDMDNIFDFEAFLSTMLSYEGTMNMQLNMSEDYQKLEMALTSESDKNIFVNNNLNVDVNSKMGMWVDMNMEDDNYNIILQLPFMNKYINLDSSFAEVDEEIYQQLKSYYTKENMEELQKTCADNLAEFAKITGRGNKYNIKMDNDGFVAYLEKVLADFAKTMPEAEIPSLDGLKILGEKGLTVNVSLAGGKIKYEKVSADISIGLAEIYRMANEEEWPYTFGNSIDFTVDLEANVSKVGTTKVEFPVLTGENTLQLDENTDDTYVPDDDYYYEEYVPYPISYINEYCGYLPVVDGEVYFPLRQTMAVAYEDSVLIGYDNDIITVSSEYFGRYNTMAIDVNSDIVLLDGLAYLSQKPIVINGTTYMSNTFFKEFLNWEVYYVYYNILDNEYEYGFRTMKY